MKPSSDKKNIIFGVVLTYIALGISLLGSFFITPVVLNNVGDKNYGLFSFCNSITTWLLLVSEALGASYIYFATKEQKEENVEKKTNTIFAKLLLIVAVLILIITISAVSVLKFAGFQFSKYTQGENDLIFILLIVSGSNVAISVLFSVFHLYNNYKKSFIFIRSLSIGCSVLNYVANLIIALTIKSIIIIAATSLFFTFLQGLFNTLYAIKYKKMSFSNIKLKKCGKEFKMIAQYSSILLISAIIGNLDSNLDKTILGIAVSAESVTMYQLSITFQGHLITLSWSLVEVMRPTLYKLYRDNNIEEANNLYLKLNKIQSIVILFIIGGFLSCGYHFVTMWIGPSRIQVFFYTSVLFVSRIVPLTSSVSGEAYRANNLHKIPFILSLISIVINLSLSISFLIILDNQFAVWACILGTTIPIFIFSYVINQIICYKLLHLPVKRYYFNLLKNLIVMILSIAPSILLTILLNNVSFPVFIKVLMEGVLFVLVYFLATFIVDRKEIRGLFQMLFRKKETEKVL